MKKYILLITVCVIYIALIIWKACGVTENEIIYQLIAYYIFPMSAAFLAAFRVRKNKVNIKQMKPKIFTQTILSFCARR